MSIPVWPSRRTAPETPIETTGIQSIEVESYSGNVRRLSLVNDEDSPGTNKVYGTSDNGTRGWQSVEITVAANYTPSSDTIQFDAPRSYGYNGLAVSGNLTVSTTGANDAYMAKVLHNDVQEPTITLPDGVTAHKSGTYEPGNDNEILFICHKNNAGIVTRISYSIIPNAL